MNSYSTMFESFEKEKNIKAFAYTTFICGALYFLFFFLQWTLPQIPSPILNEGIEVNLGNSETGLGNVAPQLPGNPSNANQTNISPVSNSSVQANQNISVNENGDETINHSTKINKLTVNPYTDNRTNISKKNNENNVAASASKPLMAKALYKGGNRNGNGGNNTDSYNGVKNQGIAGGKGDQGKPNGNPNSNNYNGNAFNGNTGVSIRNGLDGRRFTKYPNFEDDFNENAKVAVDITVDATGKVITAIINPKGTTTTNQNIRAIAVKKAKQLKLNAGKDEQQTGTIVFDFKLHG